MPQILQINECLNFSTGKIAQAIGELVIKENWGSHIAYSSRQAKFPSCSKLYKVGNLINPYFHYLQNLIWDKEGLSSRKATHRLINYIKEISPDIIHLHNIHDHWLNYQILFEFLNTTTIKVVWTFHDCWPFTGHCFHFVSKNCQRWKTGCYNCPLQKIYPKSLFDRSSSNYRLKKELFTNNKNLTIVACSYWMKNLVEQSFLKGKNIIVIQNGINLDVFKPSKEKKKSIFSILFVSNIWNKEKGLDDIFELRKLIPLDSNFSLKIVGLSRKQLRNLPDGIVGIQRTNNQQDLIDLYSEANIFINTSRADTFPTVNLEALACGTPVVTYRTGGSPEAIDDNTGLVVEKGDIQGLKKAIDTIASTTARFTVEQCRTRAERYFKQEDRFKEYIDLYNDLLRK